MAVLILDTDVFSYLNAHDQRRALPYLPHLAGHAFAVSFVTVGEQYAGYRKQVLRKQWNRSRLRALESHLGLVAIIPYDSEVCKTYGELKAMTEIAGRPVASNDLWVAACAKRHSLTLVTHNRRHFAGIPGLRIISEAHP